MRRTRDRIDDGAAARCLDPSCHRNRERWCSRNVQHQAFLNIIALVSATICSSGFRARSKNPGAASPDTGRAVLPAIRSQSSARPNDVECAGRRVPTYTDADKGVGAEDLATTTADCPSRTTRLDGRPVASRSFSSSLGRPAQSVPATPDTRKRSQHAHVQPVRGARFHLAHEAHAFPAWSRDETRWNAESTGDGPARAPSAFCRFC